MNYFLLVRYIECFNTYFQYKIKLFKLHLPHKTNLWQISISLKECWIVLRMLHMKHKLVVGSLKPICKRAIKCIHQYKSALFPFYYLFFFDVWRSVQKNEDTFAEKNDEMLLLLFRSSKIHRFSRQICLLSFFYFFSEVRRI